MSTWSQVVIEPQPHPSNSAPARGRDSCAQENRQAVAQAGAGFLPATRKATLCHISSGHPGLAGKGAVAVAPWPWAQEASRSERDRDPGGGEGQSRGAPEGGLGVPTLHPESTLPANQKSRSHLKSSPAAGGRREVSGDRRNEWSAGERAPGQSQGLASSWLSAPKPGGSLFPVTGSTGEGSAGRGRAAGPWPGSRSRQVRAWSPGARSLQVTYKNQPMNARLSGTTHPRFFLSLPPSLLPLL